MARRKIVRRSACLVLSLWLVSLEAAAEPGSWLQWGGPNRGFIAEALGLADSWPREGPRQLWRRPLGDGCSTIVVAGDTAYTLYREADREFVVALDTASGRTRWEHSWAEPFIPGSDRDSHGPYATPLIVGERLFAVGTGGKLQCLNRTTGSLYWSHDLIQKFGGKLRQFGYGASPIRYRDKVILPADVTAIGTSPSGQALVALELESGATVWQSEPFSIATIDYSSPILIDFAGDAQLVFRAAASVMGFDPDTGHLLWTHGGLEAGETYATPLWVDGGLLFCSRYSGSHMIKLTQEGGKTSSERLWASRRLGLYLGNGVRVGDYLYGSTGAGGPTLFTAVHVRTGERVWVDRSLARSSCVYGDGKLIALGENGELALCTLSPDGLTVHSRCQILEFPAWAAPTLVGQTLFVRDRKSIAAIDLG